MDKLKRITDLFTEGTELVLGEDETGTSVVIWVNKLNSFEDEEARRDGLAARAEHMMALNEGDPEVVNLKTQMAGWSKDQLVGNAASLKYDEDYLHALDDVESDKEWRGKMDYLRRIDTIHGDAGVPEDDPRRAEYVKVNEEYYKALREKAEARQKDRRAMLAESSVEDLQDQYLESVKERLTLDTFMAERRVSEVFFATRDCQGVQDEHGWNHDNCDHRRRLLDERKDVRTLPEVVLAKIVEKLNELTVDRRTAGNLDAPASSSESSEQLSLEEESSPSTQEVTAPVVVST